MNKVSLFKHLVRLAQISEELEETNPAAANLIDENASDLAQNLIPEGTNVDVSPDMFPKQTTPVIPYNQYETGQAEEFTQKQFENNSKIPFSEALEVVEEVTGEDPDWSEGVIEKTDATFGGQGGRPIQYTNEPASPEKIGEDIFNEILPIIEKGASDDEINSEIDKRIKEKLGNQA
jgi:hypothetical protein